MEAINSLLNRLSIEQVRQGAFEIQEFRAHGVLKSNGIIRDVEDAVDKTIGVGLNGLSIAIEAFTNELFSRFIELTREARLVDRIEVSEADSPGQTA